MMNEALTHKFGVHHVAHNKHDIRFECEHRLLAPDVGDRETLLADRARCWYVLRPYSDLCICTCVNI